MNLRIATVWLALAVSLGGCDARPDGRQDKPAAATPSPGAAAPVKSAAPNPVASSPAASSPSAPSPTPAAGNEQQAAAQVLEEFARALSKGDWQGAAALWSDDAGVTAQSLRDLFGRQPPQMLVIGNGEVEGAAGSLFYSTSLSFDGPDGPRRFTVTLRRVNDVPGATPAQLRWHLESMEQP